MAQVLVTFVGGMLLGAAGLVAWVKLTAWLNESGGR